MPFTKHVYNLKKKHLTMLINTHKAQLSRCFVILQKLPGYNVSHDIYLFID